MTMPDNAYNAMICNAAIHCETEIRLIEKEIQPYAIPDHWAHKIEQLICTAYGLKTADIKPQWQYVEITLGPDPYPLPTKCNDLAVFKHINDKCAQLFLQLQAKTFISNAG